MWNLNDLIPSGGDIRLLSAASIDNEGRIVGWGLDMTNGDHVAVLLSRILADLNGDCIVNVEDLLILLGEWSCSNSPADFNHDGTVNVLDLLYLLANWTV